MSASARFAFFVVFGIIAAMLPFVVAQTCTSGETRSCGISNQGECAFGTQTCIQGTWGVCQGARYPQPEACFDDKDNDCDGLVDENCVCEDGAARSCGYNNIGICSFGRQLCSNNTWQPCEGAVLPAVSDICNNGVDDDCDGASDEGCSVSSSSCTDNIQNQGELGVDCGGPCPACFSCTDGVRNPGEQGIDCGGPCPACASCTDGIQNQNETGIDCGGPCAACVPERDDADGDTLTDEEEVALGTDPLLADTDQDGLKDNLDAFPLCPNGVCNLNGRETPETCPADCKSKTNPALVYLGISAAFLVLIAVALLIAGRKKSSAKQTGNKKDEGSFSNTSIELRDLSLKDRDEDIQKLERSLEKAKKALK